MSYSTDSAGLLGTPWGTGPSFPGSAAEFMRQQAEQMRAQQRSQLTVQSLMGMNNAPVSDWVTSTAQITVGQLAGYQNAPQPVRRPRRELLKLLLTMT